MFGIFIKTVVISRMIIEWLISIFLKLAYLFSQCRSIESRWRGRVVSVVD